MRTRTSSAMCALATAVVLICAGCAAATTSPALRGDVPPVVQTGTPAAGIVPWIERTVALDAGACALDVADVTGDAAVEVIVARDSELEIRSLDGTLISRIAVAAPRLVYGFATDIDDDGKADLVLGSRGDSTSRVRVINGRGQVVAEAAFGSLVDGMTHPRFARDNVIYFTAGSAIGSTPRITGRFDPGTRRIEWLRSDGVVPTGLVYAEELDVVGIHTRGTSRDLPDARADTRTPSERSALLTVDPEGTTIAFVPLGAPVVEGTGGPEQVSLAETYPLSLAGGQNGAIVAANRESGVFAGPSRILLVDATGALLREHVGPAASRASLVLDERAGGTEGSFTVAVVWSSTGAIEVLDEELRVSATAQLPGELHNARLMASGDLDGDGARDYVVSDMDRLVIASPTSGAFEAVRLPGPVREARLASDEHGPTIAVLASDLHIVRPGPVDDPDGAAEAWRNDAPRPGAPTMRVEAKGRKSAVAALRPLAEAPLEDGWTVRGVADVSGDPTPEVVLMDVARSRVRLRSPTLELVGSFPVPVAIDGIHVVGDVDGDRKADLIAVERSTVHAVVALNGHGETLYRTPLTPGPNTRVIVAPVAGDTLWLRVVTGHLLYPRGVYALDPSRGRVRSFSPIAGFPSDVQVIGGKVFVSSYTPANGAVVEREDGQTDHDGAMFIYVLDEDGRPHPWARPAPFDPPRGTIRYFGLDADDDGEPEPYLGLSRDPSYNPGTPGVYRVADDGELEPIATGPEDDRLTTHVVRAAGRDRLVAHYPRAGIVRVFAPDLASWTDERVGDARLVGVRGSGDVVELWLLADGRVELVPTGGSRLASVSWPDMDVKRARLAADPAGTVDYLIVEGDGRLGVVEVPTRGVVE